jgi:hypothetical protein
VDALKAISRWWRNRKRLAVGDRRRVLRSSIPEWVGRVLTIQGPGEYDGWDAEVLFDGDSKTNQVGLRWLREDTEAE